MRRPTRELCYGASWLRRNVSSTAKSLPLIQISNGSFRGAQAANKAPDNEPAPSNELLFRNISISIPSYASPNQNWAVLSPSSFVRTTFLQILRGQLVCEPASARTFPFFGSEEIRSKDSRLAHPEKALQYVGFDTERRAYGGAYLSARYESRVEETDFTLEQYLTGISGLNVSEEFRREQTPRYEAMLQVVRDLELERFFKRPVSMLSNGQSRRARIGKALLTKPEMLLLDAPFIGLDPFVTEHISELLCRLAEANAPRVLVSLRPQDIIPHWITHLIYAGEDCQVQALGTRAAVLNILRDQYSRAERIAVSSGANSTTPAETARNTEMRDFGRLLSERGEFQGTIRSPQQRVSIDGIPTIEAHKPRIGEPVVQMEGVTVQYGGNAVLGDWSQQIEGTSRKGLWWTVRQGQRVGIFGANGSGKTTLLSLITSDHPQTYSAPVRLFQKSRLPSPGQPGISIFELQARMGHASPEVHALFPRQLSVRRSLESAFADTPLTKPSLNADATARVEACLQWFAPELNPRKNTREAEKASFDLAWATNTLFGELPFSSQRLVLFLRALVRSPEIIILDEAFSGMDDLVRDKCMLFLSQGQLMQLDYTAIDGSIPTPIPSQFAKDGNAIMRGLSDQQALLCVSHQKEDVPGCVREWICLPEAGAGVPRFGRLDGPVELDPRRWTEIWGQIAAQRD